MLLNNLYTIESLKESAGQIDARIVLNPDHEIFGGHFPGQPVLPGVCMMEMITEILGKQTQNEFRIKTAPIIKFLLMIDPRRNAVIDVEIKYETAAGQTNSSGKIYSGTEVFMKFQMNLEAD